METKFKVGDRVVRKKEYQSSGKVWGSAVWTVAVVDGGYAGIEGVAGRWDIVFFDPAPVPAKQYPKAGEYWRQRDGAVVGPLKVDARSLVIHLGEVLPLGSNEYWYPSGTWRIREEHPLDLMERAEVCAHCGKPRDSSV